MKKKIQLYQYIFDLKISYKGNITQCECSMVGKDIEKWSEEEHRQSQIYRNEIFEGKHDWLIDKGIITLPTHNILVTLEDVKYDGSVRYGAGTITSSMKETCPYCKDTNCDFDCPESFKWQNIKDTMTSLDKRAELESNRNYNYACDALEALILAHAVAGVNVESPAYLEGLETAIDAIANNL